MPKGRLATMFSELEEVSPLRRNKFFSDVAFCPRRAVIFRHAAPSMVSSTSVASKLYMSFGTAAHRVLQKQLGQVGILVESERYIRREEPALGCYIDAIVKMNGKKYVMEIKTCGKLPDEPKPEAPFQTGLYMFLTKIPRGVVVYVSRSVYDWRNSKLLIREFQVGPIYVERAIHSLAVAQTYHEHKRLPPVPSHIGARSHCTFCPFIKLCWNHESIDCGLAMDGASLNEQVDAWEERLRSELPWLA